MSLYSPEICPERKNKNAQVFEYRIWAFMESVQYRKYVDLCYEQFPSLYIPSFSINLSSEVIKVN